MQRLFKYKTNVFALREHLQVSLASWLFVSYMPALLGQ